MKRLLTFTGSDAIKVAMGTNRLPEVLDEESNAWNEEHIWKARAIADRFPHRVRVRGYKSVLLKSATDEAADIINR